MPTLQACPRSLLTELPVLFVDAQATAADPRRGALIEIGWAKGSAAALPPPDVVSVQVVAPPPGLAMPPAVARVTGVRTSDWECGVAPSVAWERLRQAMAQVASMPVPAVIHFAAFEGPWLRALHEWYGQGPFPMRCLCTHAVARRLLPELPRRTLRALAGYFGAGVPPLRRCAEHVVATAFVWRELVTLLAEQEGVLDTDGLQEWMARPPRRCTRRFPLPRERRLGLPTGPGVYRLLRAGGDVLYVGKATSLRQRVSGHFHPRGGEKALEMLTQTRDVSCTETATALEAALLEADEIKRLAPPFNVALAGDGRAVWFATADLRSVAPCADAAHVLGPFVAPEPIEALSALQTILSLREPGAPSLVQRARAVGVEPAWAPEPGCFAEGVARFRRAHASVETTRALLRLGAHRWACRLAARNAPPLPDAAGREDPRPTRRPGWDAERVAQALEEMALRAAHAVRRGRWLCRLSESSLAWSEADRTAGRQLAFGGGRITGCSDIEAGAPLTVPPGHARRMAERRAAFDVAAFDRLRVLTTELRAQVTTAERLELRLGPHVRLTRRRLERVLRWV